MKWTKRNHGTMTNDYLTPLHEAQTDRYGETATQVLMWYNPYEKSWVVSLADAEGHQVGPSRYVYSKAEAIEEAQFLVNGSRVIDRF